LKIKSIILPKYEQSREDYGVQFPSAYRFLMALQSYSDDGLWLSTAVNAHLYKGNAFLAYICLPGPQALTLSPHFNLGLREGTGDCSGRLFPKGIREVLERHQAEGVGWWRTLSRDRFELSSGTPEIVFEELLAKIRSLPSVADICSIRPHRLDGTMPCEPRND
jgi:hypothetical protein